MPIDRRWAAAQRRYRRIARRALEALPAKRIARRGLPVVYYSVPFNGDDPQAVTGAINELAAIVKQSGQRRYFPREPAHSVEHDVRLEGKGRALQLLRYYDVQKGRMVARLGVALG